MPFLFIGIILHGGSLSRLYEIVWVRERMQESCKKALPAFPLPLEKMKLKKRNTDGVVPPRYVLTQGSLHYRLATLGYQKQNPDGVRQFCKHPLRRSSFWQEMKLKKRNAVDIMPAFPWMNP